MYSWSHCCDIQLHVYASILFLIEFIVALQYHLHGNPVNVPIKATQVCSSNNMFAQYIYRILAILVHLVVKVVVPGPPNAKGHFHLLSAIGLWGVQSSFYLHVLLPKYIHWWHVVIHIATKYIYHIIVCMSMSWMTILWLLVYYDNAIFVYTYIAS